MITRYRAFNARLALFLTQRVSTMECAYLFFALALLGFPQAGSPPSAYVQWVSQTCIQLVMLSVIMVGQDIQAQRTTTQHDEQMTHHRAHAARLDAIEWHIGMKKQQYAQRTRDARGRFSKAAA